MATGGARDARTGGMEAAGERRDRRGSRVPEDARMLRELLELRQRQLRSRIAACEELTAALVALRAALSPGPGPGDDGPWRAPAGPWRAPAGH